MHHSTTKNIKTYIVSIDQEKAFDKVDKISIQNAGKTWTLKNTYYLVKKIYKNTQSVVISNNGFLSTPFPLCRGVRQGCPLALLMYIINGEVINLIIKWNEKNVESPIPNQKEDLKLSQYADDTKLFCNNSRINW